MVERSVLDSRSFLQMILEALSSILCSPMSTTSKKGENFFIYIHGFTGTETDFKGFSGHVHSLRQNPMDGNSSERVGLLLYFDSRWIWVGNIWGVSEAASILDIKSS
jgi:hypothetical protein